MIILDTDHLSVLKYSGSKSFEQLAKRMADSTDQAFVTTAISLKEQLRDWLAQFDRSKDAANRFPLG